MLFMPALDDVYRKFGEASEMAQLLGEFPAKLHEITAG
jgi:hypothetical protein